MKIQRLPSYHLQNREQVRNSKNTKILIRNYSELDEEANDALFGEGDGTNIDTSQFDEAPLELTKKKKKKKDKVIDLDLDEDGIDELGDEIGDLKLEKKKKKKKNVDFKDETEVNTILE